MRPSGGVGWIGLRVKWIRLSVKQYGAGEAAGAIRTDIARYPEVPAPGIRRIRGAESGPVGFVAL
jgi:hypothetical protein